MKEKLIRPVKCHFCDQPMYYAGDEKHEPEVRVSLETGSVTEWPEHQFYAHIRCWNERMSKTIVTHNK